LANQIVEFSLTIEAGGLQLGNASDVSDANSKVSTEVFVGDIPISVRVNASVCAAGGQFHNRRGVVESSCLTSAGVCAVTWTTTQPRPTNGRGTVLATAIGHETLCDSNGNNVFDDGGTIEDTFNTQSGFGTDVFSKTGFIDHSEAWRDNNEDGERSVGELFLDYNDDQDFNGADNLFNRSQCQSSELYGQGIASTLPVRKNLVLIMSSSRALMDIIDTSNTIIFSHYQAASQPSLSIDSGSSLNLGLRFSDTSVQPIANVHKSIFHPVRAALGGK
jgi:hypothetical protein